MRKTAIAAGLLAASLAAAGTTAAGAAPPDRGNCLANFVNGGAQGSAVSSDPGGPQASGELGQFLRAERGCPPSR